MFTQLNQYHVVLEVKPEFQKNPLDLRDLFIRTGIGSFRYRGRAGVRRLILNRIVKRSRQCGRGSNDFDPDVL